MWEAVGLAVGTGLALERGEVLHAGLWGGGKGEEEMGVVLG